MPQNNHIARLTSFAQSRSMGEGTFCDLSGKMGSLPDRVVSLGLEKSRLHGLLLGGL